MSDPRLSCGGEYGRRQWSFADCLFDESNWTLTVAGRRVAIESKPLEILRQLLLKPQQVVSKAELLDAIWPGLAVVEASLPTAVHKLRVALGDEARAAALVETVPRIGYRLGCPATVTGQAPRQIQSAKPVELDDRGAWFGLNRMAAAAVIVAALSGGVALSLPNTQSAETVHTPRPTPAEVDKALRKLDVDRIDGFIAAGWDVNMAMDKDRNTALNRLLDMCEWDPNHDRRRMLLMARTLVDGGTRLIDHNAFGDTPYSIAKTPRFCGPSHPVTMMLHRLCYNGGGANNHGDRCLATYELKRMASRS